MNGKLILEAFDNIDIFSTDVPSTEVSAVSSGSDAGLSSSHVDTESVLPTLNLQILSTLIMRTPMEEMVA